MDDLEKEKTSIEGTLLMLDDTTPHTAVPVQVIRDGEVIATTLSDEHGRYQFIDLKPGRYQVRCYTMDGYVYYGEEKARKEERPLYIVPVPLMKSTTEAQRAQRKKGEEI